MFWGGLSALGWWWAITWGFAPGCDGARRWRWVLRLMESAGLVLFVG